MLKSQGTQPLQKPCWTLSSALTHAAVSAEKLGLGSQPIYGETSPSCNLTDLFRPEKSPDLNGFIPEREESCYSFKSFNWM